MYAPVKEYSKEQQTQAANELRACGGNCKEVKEMLKDGHVLRQQNRPSSSLTGS